MIQFLAQVFAYLLGGIPFGYLIAKSKAGIDIREHGSGNIGATNVARVLGFRYFLIVFLLDFLKGAVPVAVALWIQSQPTDEDTAAFYALPELVGLAAILGHMFPIYLGLRGGKGVATSIGVLLMLTPGATLIGLLAFAVVAGLTRMVSAGSIAFATGFAIGFLLVTTDPFEYANLPRSMFVLAASTLVIFRHRTNIGRIILGTEPRFQLSRKSKS